jgi:hypothetical protein
MTAWVKGRPKDRIDLAARVEQLLAALLDAVGQPIDLGVEQIRRLAVGSVEAIHQPHLRQAHRR